MQPLIIPQSFEFFQFFYDFAIGFQKYQIVYKVAKVGVTITKVNNFYVTLIRVLRHVEIEFQFSQLISVKMTSDKVIEVKVLEVTDKGQVVRRKSIPKINKVQPLEVENIVRTKQAWNDSKVEKQANAKHDKPYYSLLRKKGGMFNCSLLAACQMPNHFKRF